MISQAINELYQSKLADSTGELIECDFMQFVKQLQTGFAHGVLDLKKMQFGISVIAKLPRVMRLVPTVTRLNFYGNSIEDSGLSKIYQLLQMNPQIKYIDIGSNDLSDDCIVSMTDIVENIHLRSLQLGSFDSNYQTNRFTREFLESIMDILAKKNLIRCFGIGNVGSIKQKKTNKAKKFSKYISKLLVSCTGLLTLNISKCNLVDSDQSILSSGFSENKNLKYLDIHENYFPSGTRLIDGISHLNHLIYLNLSNCSLSEASCLALAKRIGEGWGLISLNISQNREIGNDGIIQLLSVLPSNIYLVSLNISDTGFDSKVNPKLRELFEMNQILQELDLSMNLLGDSVANAFNALTLHSIKMDSCRITDVGAITISKSLISNKTLKKLSLKDNFLTKEIGYELVHNFQQNETLTCIDLSSTQVDCFAVDTIKSICARNKNTMHNNKLSKLRKEYIHLSIQDSKIPGVVAHLKELRVEHEKLDEEIENLNFNIETFESSAKMSIHSVEKEIDEFKKAINAQEEQIVEMQEKITELQSNNQVALKNYEINTKREQEEFNKVEIEAEKIEKETERIKKESTELQEKLNQEINNLDEMLNEVTRISRNKKKLRDYQIPVYPYEEEEAEKAAKEENSAEERAAKLAQELALLDETFGIYHEEEEEKKGKKKKKGKASKKDQSNKSSRPSKKKKQKSPEKNENLT